MGLDSVELLVEIEKYFGIQVPNAEAEKIVTIQKMVDAVAAHLDVYDERPELRDRIFHRIADALLDAGLCTTPLQLTDRIFDYIYPGNKNLWQDFEKRLGLRVDAPYVITNSNNKLVDRIKSVLWPQPLYDWTAVTAEQFTAVVCASNYNELIDRNNITGRYEIYIAVAGITVDRIGVEYYEIAPEKSFMDDLGVD